MSTRGRWDSSKARLIFFVKSILTALKQYNCSKFCRSESNKKPQVVKWAESIYSSVNESAFYSETKDFEFINYDCLKGKLNKHTFSLYLVMLKRLSVICDLYTFYSSIYIFIYWSLTKSKEGFENDDTNCPLPGKEKTAMQKQWTSSLSFNVLVNDS